MSFEDWQIWYAAADLYEHGYIDCPDLYDADTSENVGIVNYYILFR